MEDWLMTAFNVVRVRVKPGREDEFIEAHRRASPDLPGFQRGVLIKTGERAYCMGGEWDSMDALASLDLPWHQSWRPFVILWRSLITGVASLIRSRAR
jgi:hypothetical protein